MGIGNDIERMIENEIESQVEKAIEKADIDGAIQEAVEGYDWSEIITSDLVESNVDFDSMVQDAIDDKVDSKVNELLDSSPVSNLLERIEDLGKECIRLQYNNTMLASRVEKLEKIDLEYRLDSTFWGRLGFLFFGK